MFHTIFTESVFSDNQFKKEVLKKFSSNRYMFSVRFIPSFTFVPLGIITILLNGLTTMESMCVCLCAKSAVVLNFRAFQQIAR